MKKFYTCLCFISISCITYGQLAITAADTPYAIDFSGFNASGIASPAATGQLASDMWSLTGFSDGDIDFGGSAATGDFARGITPGGVIIGGLYAVDDGSNQMPWIQPTAADFDPGSMILRTINNSGDDINEIDISYTIYCLNDQERANNFNLSYSFDNISYYPVPSADYVSPEAADGILSNTPRSANITGLSVADGAYIYLRWSSEDVSGSGSRDEFGLDDITIEAPTVAPTPIVSFNTALINLDENDPTANFSLSVSSTTDCDVNLSVSAVSSATEGLDYDYAIAPTLLFLSGEATTANLSIGITDDDEDEGDETIIVQITSVAGTCVLGAPNIITVVIHDNDTTIATLNDIADVTTNDANGNAISLGQYVTLEGIVYGVNLADAGLEFTLIDATGGIAVFSFANDFGYTVQEGDKVNITGTITQFNGLTQIEPDTVILVSTGNTLKIPIHVVELSETSESNLVYLHPIVNFVDESQWLGDGSSFNVDVTDGISTWTMRIDNNTELASTPFATLFEMVGAPLFGFNITGLGSQYDASAPYTDGYEIYPRYASDISTIFIEDIDDISQGQLSIYPNPAADYITTNSKNMMQSIELYNSIGALVLQQQANAFTKTLSIKNIAAGAYIMKIYTDSGVYATHFIKN